MTVNHLVPAGVPETPALTELRHEVRAFLNSRIADGSLTPRVDAWITGWDPDFSRELAARGWVGMTVPAAYGGHGRTFVERFVVTEELLAAGAPVAAHWVADRQAAPSLLRFGTEEQKQHYLPRIAAGECFFAIGMSEPDSGSDLASVRTRARRVDGGWSVTGTKVWTSGAHAAEAFFVLARTSPLDTSARHAGLSQLIVELRSDGVQVRPIVSMTGQHHFNEVHLDDVFVPDARVLGDVGAGWHQVTSELAYERSGPERFLSTFPLFRAQVRRAAAQPEGTPADPAIGRALARLRGLHHMSMAVNAAVERGDRADTAAAVVKVLGTSFEGDLVEAAQLGGGLPDSDPLLAAGLLQRPGFTLRGGTSEILRGVIARGMGLR
ncbi:putative acyl-CoA dehydrogenase [Janibacter sp. HTCC2649]|uniref:acyl-CoA dehydrogenase family protein n=1 Tax=Janibacter sp. HTCC2649 TaxID=313589 RepID=UPI0000670BA8|nr:acyl-CoA dehydrogenase family protein [Janibacter sp. HTCC2649]EAQ00586.1 putative acyl-CoA dehydrogenase [Janibacter sp. HTCC2649]